MLWGTRDSEQKEGPSQPPALPAIPWEALDMLVKHLECSRTRGAAQASAKPHREPRQAVHTKHCPNCRIRSE